MRAPRDPFRQCVRRALPLAAVSAILAAQVARAEPPSAYADPLDEPDFGGPTFGTKVPDASPNEPEEKRYKHDGFQLRLAVGPSYLRDSVNDTARPSPTAGRAIDLSATLTGPGYGGEIQLGGNISSHVVLGAGLSWARTFHPSRDGGARIPTVIEYGITGAYLDWFPDPLRGLHLQLFAGLGVVSLSRNEDASIPPSEYGKVFEWRSTESMGFGFAPAAGYEWWIAEQWSLGVLGRLTVINASTDGNPRTSVLQTHRLLAPSLLATLSLH